MAGKEKNSKSKVPAVSVSETISRERQLEIIFNTTTDIIFLISIERGSRYRFTSVNQAFLSTTGLNREQVEGKYITDVVPASSQSIVIAKYQQAINERKTIQWEEISDYPAGKKTGIVSITPVFNDQSECTMLMGTVHDITATKESERILKESEFKLRMVVENGLLGIAWASAEGKLINANLTFCKMLGYTLDEILDVYFGNFTHPEDTQKEEHLINQMAAGEIDNYRMEKRYKTKQGNYLWVELNLTCYRDMVDRNIEFFIGIIQDINDRKRAEEQVLKEKELSESIINSLPGIFYLFDNTGKYLRWNKNHETVPGYTTEEMRMMYPLNFFDADEKELIKEKIEKVFKEGYASAEANFMGKDGQKTPYYFNGIAIEYEGKPCLMGVAFDVSEKKLLEQEIMNRKIQEQKKMTRAVLNAQEKERNKIGQELHDNVNQILVGSKMYLGLAGEQKPINESLIQQSIALIDKAINEIRVLTHDYVTPQRSIHLKDIIQLLLDNLDKHSFIKTKFVYDAGSIDIKDDLKLNIYRIIQESINNILKHASARNASFIVKVDKDSLHVEIKDDGQGFDTTVRKTKGIGLSNMLSRVESYNGKMTIKSRPGRGCKIELTIPI